MAKYIDAVKLLAEIEIIRHSLDHRDVRFDQIKQIQTDTMSEFCKMMKETIDSLQQTPQDVGLEKASRNVYESWMGGTMNDVRRDMVELGKVLNARKEESK